MKGRLIASLLILFSLGVGIALLDRQFYDLDLEIVSFWSEIAGRDRVEVGFADVTADGRADAIAVVSDGIMVRRSIGERFEASELWREGSFRGELGVFFADADGDGRADAIFVNETGISVARSTLKGFAALEPWADELAFGPFFGDRQTFVTDLNGDLRADVVMINDANILVRPSTGESFGRAEVWSETAFYGERETAFADVDGDRHSDAIVVNPDGIVVRRVVQSKLGDAEIWADDLTYGPFLGDRGNFFADVDGDGRADAVMVNDDNILVRYSKGESFGRAEFLSYTPFYGEQNTFFADVTGNEVADAIAVNSDEILVRLTTANQKP